MDNFILEKLAPLLRRPNSLCSLGGSSGARSGKVNIAMTPTAFSNLVGEFMGVDMMQGCLPQTCRDKRINARYNPIYNGGDG